MRLTLTELPPQHPIYGIRRANMVRRLTMRNWQEKAVVRVSLLDATLSYYLWIRDMGEGVADPNEEGKNADDENSEASRYHVCCVPDCPDRRSYARGFDAVEDAVGYINGSTPHTPLALETRPATRSELPPDNPPLTTIRGRS